jgi:hypothetical protein
MASPDQGTTLFDFIVPGSLREIIKTECYQIHSITAKNFQGYCQIKGEHIGKYRWVQNKYTQLLQNEYSK